MFQAIVHAPALRPGVRLCISDFEQTTGRFPASFSAGDALQLRYGACCPGHGAAAFASRETETAILRVGDDRWRLRRCPLAGGVALPGLVAEDWFVVARDA